MVTHLIQYAAEADKVVVFEKGKIVSQGGIEEVKNYAIDKVEDF